MFLRTIRQFKCFFLFYILSLINLLNRKQNIYGHIMIMILLSLTLFFFLSQLSLTLFHLIMIVILLSFLFISLYFGRTVFICNMDVQNQQYVGFMEQDDDDCRIMKTLPIKDLSNLCFSLSDLKSKSQKKLKSKSLLM